MTNERMDVSLARHDQDFMNMVMSQEGTEDFLSDHDFYRHPFRCYHLYNFIIPQNFKRRVACDFSGYMKDFERRLPMAQDISIHFLIVNSETPNQVGIMMMVGCSMRGDTSAAKMTVVNKDLDKDLMAISDRVMTLVATKYHFHECVSKAIEGMWNYRMPIQDFADPMSVKAVIANPSFKNMGYEPDPERLQDLAMPLVHRQDSVMKIITSCQVTNKYKAMPNREFTLADEAFQKRMDATIGALSEHLQEIHEDLQKLDLGATSIALSSVPRIERRGNRFFLGVAIVAGVDFPQESNANGIAQTMRDKTLAVATRIMGPALVFPEATVVAQECAQEVVMGILDPDQ